LQAQHPTHAPAELPKAFGKYTLLTRLATGGMAELYIALLRAEFGFQKPVVVKCLLPFLHKDTRFITMFLDEARTASTLSHPNIVQMFDAGEVDGTFYIAMEFIEGLDLRSLIRQRGYGEKAAIPVEHAIYVINEVLAGLEYAHQKRDFSGAPLRIVHRDISPQNLIVTFGGHVKIVDFGVAKSAVQLGEKTGVGQLKGKLGYMSPEQARGQTIDWRSDLFSVGVVLCELTTGYRVFKGEHEVETLRKIWSSDFIPPSQIRPDYPPELEAIILRALAADRRQRYQSARELQIDLLKFARRHGLEVSQLGFATWVEHECRKARLEQASMLQQLGREATQRRASSPSWTPELAPVRSSAPPPPMSSLPAPSGALPALPLITPRAGTPAAGFRPSSAPPPPPVPTSIESVRTLRGSTQTLPPSEELLLRPRWRRRWIGAGAAVGVIVVIVFFTGIGTGEGPGPAAQRVAGFAERWIAAPMKAGFRQITGQTPAPVTLELELSPDHARVWLDERPLSGRQLSGLVPTQVYRLRVEAAGFQTKQVEIRPSEHQGKIYIALEPKGR